MHHPSAAAEQGGGEGVGAAPLQGRQFRAVNVFLLHPYVFGPGRQYPQLLPLSPNKTGHTTAFIIQVMEHWLEREIAQWVHH